MTAPDRPRRDPTFYLSGLVAALWVALAWTNPDTTYHAAPPLVAGVFPAAHRWRAGPLPPAAALAAGFGGWINVVVVGIALGLADLLRGPSLLPAGGPLAEALILGAGGALLGAVVAVLPKREHRIPR